MRRVILALSFLTLAIPGSSGRLVAAEDARTARGTVRAIGADWMSVAVGPRQFRFDVDEKTSVVAPGGGTATRRADAGARPAPRLAEFVKPGTAVQISYVDRGGSHYAEDIHVIASAGPGGGSLSTDRPPVETANGAVAHVAADSLSLATDAGVQAFVVDGGTRVFVRGASAVTAATDGRARLADLVREGDRVSVSYHELDGTRHAQEVRVMTPNDAPRR